MKQYVVWFIAVGLAAAVAACEPDSIADARDQLGRGGSRQLAFTIPVKNDTITVADVLEDFVGLSIGDLDGVAAVAIQAESIRVAVGDELRFDDVGFDQFVFSFDQMLRTSEASTNVDLALAPPAPSAPFGAAQQQPGQIEFSTPDGSEVTSATIDTGTVVRTLTNSTTCPATVSMTLRDGDGDVVVAFADTPVGAAGSGTDVVVDSQAVAGVTADQFVEVDMTADPGACIPAGGSVSADVTFRPMTLAVVSLANVQETFTEQDDLLAGETRFNSIDTVDVASGGVTLDFQNRLPIALNVSLELNGVLDAAGNPVSAATTVPAAPGDGATTSASLNIDLTGARVAPATARWSVTGTATAASADITPTNATDAVIVDGGGSLEVGALRGMLDPTQTSELTIAIEETQELPADNLDLGEFEDVVRDATLNAVRLDLRVTNDADVPVSLPNFQIGAVRIDPNSGLPFTLPNGELDYETDASGNPIIVQTTVEILPSGTTTVSLADAASVELLNRLVDLLIDDERVALAGSGTAVVGDGSYQATITSADAVSVVFDLTIGLDFTLPATGAEFGSSTVEGGLDLEDDERRDVRSTLDSAGITVEVDNGTPFQVEAEIALVGDSIGGDVFAAPGAVLLDPVSVDAAAVDAQGRVQTPATSSITAALSAEEAEVFFGPKFTAGLRVRILPPPGPDGRGALRSTDQIVVRASAQVYLRTGGGQ